MRLLFGSAVAFALAAAFLELAVLGIRKLFLHEFIHRGVDVLWMGPLAYVGFFLIPALLVLPIRLWRPSRIGVRTMAFLFAFGAAGSVLLVLVYSRIHEVAILILAAGIGVQMARWAGSNPDRFRRLTGRFALAGSVLVVLMGLGLTTYRHLAERRSLAELPPARDAAPNVLLLILDTVRASSLSLYGYERETSPGLQELAREATVFDRAVSTSPWTLPSHASMFTGHYPHQLSASWLTPMGTTRPTLAEAFRRQGYRTGAFVANLAYATYEHGLDRGFLRYEDYDRSLGQIVRSTAPGRILTSLRRLRPLIGTDELAGRKSAAEVNRDLLSWLDGTGERPFFAFLNYYDAHDPYLPPDPFFRKFARHERTDRLSPLRRWGLRERRDRVSEEEIEMEIDAYDGAIAYIDRELERLLDRLRDRGLRENTIIIITSDHGEEFGEHGVFYHGHTLYMPALHVPLIIAAPGRAAAGRRVRDPVSLRDLAATIVDLADLRSGFDFPGVSLARTWAPSPDSGDISPLVSEVRQGIRLPEWYPAARGDLKSLAIEAAHYIENPGGEGELYDWYRDPTEIRDIAGRASGQRLVRQLASRLDSILSEGSTRRRVAATAIGQSSSSRGEPRQHRDVQR